jgi:hypothetical protein
LKSSVWTKYRRAYVFDVMEIDKLEIWMIAGLLLDEHGSFALDIAQQRAGKALTEDDITGHAVWRAVRLAAATYLATGAARRRLQ